MTALTAESTHSMLVELASIVAALKADLRTIDSQLGEMPQTNLPEAAATRVELLDAKQQTLNEWIKCAEIVQDRIRFIEGRNSLDDYREIVPLVAQLDTWAQDEALSAKENTVKRLQAFARSAIEIKDQVRSQLVGAREARAREYMALAEQAREVPFVRALPLLNACQLWAEVAEIVKGIEEPLAEHQTAKDELVKCNEDMLRITFELQIQRTRAEVVQLTSDWRDAKSPEDQEATLSSIRQLLPLSPSRIPIPDDFLDAFWLRHEMSVANKVIEIRVQRLLQRAIVTALGFEERSSALREAQGLVQNSDNDLLQQIDTAWKQLRSDATGSLKECDQQFEKLMAEKLYDDAAATLNRLTLTIPYCDDETRWSRRLNELGNRLDRAKQPSEPEIALQRLIEMMDSAIQSEPRQMYDALESIEEVRRHLPSELSEVPDSLKDEAIHRANELVPKLPKPEGPTQNMKRRYIDDICNGKIGLQAKGKT